MGRMTHEERAARRALLAKAVEAGESVFDVAGRFGVSAQTVHAAAKAAGLKWANGRRVSAPGAFAVLAAVWDGERTMLEVARQFGVSKQYVSLVYRDAVRAGLPVPRRSRND